MVYTSACVDVTYFIFELLLRVARLHVLHRHMLFAAMLLRTLLLYSPNTVWFKRLGMPRNECGVHRCFGMEMNHVYELFDVKEYIDVHVVSPVTPTYLVTRAVAVSILNATSLKHMRYSNVTIISY